MSKLDTRDKLKLLRTMLVSRLGDLREQSLIRQGKGWFHISGMGHEALSVAGYLLREGDFHVGHYRDRPIIVARGVNNYDLALAYFAKRASSSGGRQMPAHYSNRKLGIFSVNSVVGASVLPATGLAWAIKLDNKPNIVLTTIGDAGTRQGDFYEALAFAIERQLPVVFLVEDNGIGISTKTSKTNPLALGLFDKSIWNMVDGCDVDAVFDVVNPAIRAAREGLGPQLIWCRTERISSHSSADDHRKYRPEQELAGLDEKDPINRLRDDLNRSGALTRDAYDKLRKEIEDEIRSDYTRAEADVDPRPEDLLEHVFGETTPAPMLRLDKEKGQARMVDLINATFKSAAMANQDLVFFGEDIEDPKGGVFSMTKGLSSMAPGQVFNSPLAESTIIGVSVGMAAYGKRPVFEIQFTDFIWPGFNQLVSQLSTLSWRSNGEWTAPAVIYAPYGAYLPGGALWHSQSNESVFAHFPGLMIAIPSTPEDAAGLFWTAMHGDSPCLILIPKHLMWSPRTLEAPVQPVPFGKAAIRSKGSEITIVAWGNTTEIVQQASELLGNPDSLEIIDLRTVAPLDMETIRTSVRKTGRILIVQEDVETCSIGQNILSTLCSDGEVFNQLQSPPCLLGRLGVNIGFNPVLEYAALPDKKQVAEKIQELLGTKLVRHFQPAPFTRAANPALELMKESMASNPEEKSVFAKEIRVPMLGEGITNAKVISLIAQPGESIEQDDPLCELETDKALFPVEASEEGTFLEWKISEGDDVEVDQVIASLEVTQLPAPPGTSKAEKQDGRLPEEVKCSEGGLPAHVIAQLKHVVPTHMTVMAGWSPIREARKQAKLSLGKSAPSPTVMVAWCLVQAMKRHSVFCCTVDTSNSLVHNEVFDFGVAVALQKDALDTAIIPKASELDWPAFTQAYLEAVEAARTGKIRSKASVPLILTSMGGFSVREALPLVVPPAIGTLFLGEAHWERRDEKEHCLQTALCLSFDHRWLNGAAGAHFLQDVKQEMESFSLEELNQPS